MMIRRAGSRLAALSRSIALLIALFVGLPWVLVAASRARFGGGAPLHGVPAPGEWQAGRIKQVLTERLTDDTIADVVIRLSLIVVWCALVVLAVTIVTEVVHMAHHDGLSVPDIRGLGMPQSVARVIATGLLVIVPMIANPPRAGARDEVTQLLPAQRVAAAFVSQNVPPGAAPDNVWVALTSSDSSRGTDGVGGFDHLERASPDQGYESGRYVVRPGDSVYGIAGRLAGPDPGAVADFAERLLELNLGMQMPDGRHFTNAAFIDIGWVLQLPPLDADAVAPSIPATSHVVGRGESLWSIADGELGDPARWREIYDLNRGRSFDDGRELVDPDRIQPGWDLVLPGTDGGRGEPSVASEPARPDNVWESTVPAARDGHGTDESDRVAAEVPSEAVADDEPGGRADAAPVSSSSVPVQSESAPMELDRAVAESDVAGADRQPTDAPELLTFTNAAMLSAGVVTLLAARRRNQLRRSRPRNRVPAPAPGPALTERKLRAIDPGDRLGRLDVAIRSLASVLIAQNARVLAALVSSDGDLELRLSGEAVLPAPWFGAADIWHLAASTPIELLVEDASRVGSPCPTMIQLGRDPDGCDVYVDLEACEAIEIGGSADLADAIVAAAAATLAGSVLAEVTTLIGLGVPDEAFLGHRLHVPVTDGQGAFDAAREAIGSTASAAVSTFELRSRAVAGEAWEPAVVLAGSAAGALTPPRVRTGMAVLSASPIHGPSYRMAPDGDAWQLAPIGLRLLPIGLGPADIAALADLVDVRDPVPEPVDVLEIGGDDTIVEHGGRESDDTDHRAVDRGQGDRGRLDIVDDTGDGACDDIGDEINARAGLGNSNVPVTLGSPDGDAATDAELQRAPVWRLMVRLLGPVEVVSAEGETVTFERSKARELIAWLATHRANSTRSAARTALWELDVRDATFANVVSEARRSLARLVEPPVGDEWVGRTMTESLPLHELVQTDADLVEHALAVARLQPPAQAIATLSPVVELINGLPFEGTSYLWPDPEGITSNLVLLATSAAAELGDHCLSVGDISGLFRATSRGLRVLPGHEELIGLRMKAHARAGDHAGVRQEWESYERVINADPWSDGEPSPKLVELRRDLLNPSR